MKLFRGVLIGCAAAAAALALWLPGWLDTWENGTWDWRVRLLARPGAATEKVRLILLDQQTLDWAKRENGLSWPWPREVYDAIIRYCRRSGARSLTFDVLYTEPSKYGVADDRAFGAAIGGAPPFVGALFLSRRQGETNWPADLPGGRLSVTGLDAWMARTAGEKLTFTRATFPIPEVGRNAAMLGNVHLNPDPDGVYRRTTLFGVFDGYVVPSLALGTYLAGRPQVALSLRAKELIIDGTAVPLDRSGSAILNFRGPSGAHRAYSAAAVIQSELRLERGETPVVEEGAFTDSHVLFGFSAPGLYDLRPVPVSGVYPAVEIHATALDNILSGDFIRGVPATVTALVAVVLAVLAGILTSLSSGIAGGFLLYLVFLGAPVVLSCAAYRAGFWLPLVVLASATGLALAAVGVVRYSVEGRQRRFIKGAFEQYLNPAVIERLIAHPELLRLGGERRTLTIFFSDIAGFTSISERLDPEVLTALLNDYLSAMTDVIRDEGGTVDKFEGDGIVAFWNAPLDQEDHAARCVRAALRCQRRLAELSPGFRRRAGADLFMRIGISTGVAVVGNMGSEDRFDYTALGDAVNLAARLEGVNKLFGTGILISEGTRGALAGTFPLREVSRVAVVGRREPVRVYEPFLFEVYADRTEEFERFGEGRDAFYRGEFEAGGRIFSSLAGSDPVASAYVRECRRLIEDPPDAWDGIWIMTGK